MIVLRHANAHVVGSLCAATLLPSIPTVALASSGGGGLSGPSPQPSASSLPSATVAGSGDGRLTAKGRGITISTQASAMLRRGLRVTGKAPARKAGYTIEIQRLGNDTGWRWAATAWSRIRRNGSFSAAWSTDHTGRFAIRAVVRDPRSASAAGPSPTLTVTVYRPSVATIYGPVLYGHSTACGQRLGPQTLGVANRTLKCGTPVAIYYNGRAIVVPVIDRGPYANGADWDLTQATAHQLGIGGTATIGAVSLPSS